MCVAMIDTPCFVGIIVIQRFCEIFDTVAAQRSVSLPREAYREFKSSHEFHTHTITLRHIHSHWFTYLVQLARKYQLIFIVHIIEVDSTIEP